MKGKTRPPARSSGQSTQEAPPPFREVYDQNAAHVWWTLRRLGVAAAWCDDASQEVFLIVHRRLPEYEPRGRLKGWLGAIAFRVAAKFRNREGDMETFDDDSPHEAPGPFELEGEIASADEVLHVLQQVDPELRFVFMQHDFDRVPVAEIAKHLEIPVGTVKTRLRLARKRIRAAWTRLKAQQRHEERSNVIPIAGALTFLEAGRQTPPLPAEVHARIWAGIQARLGGGGDGGPGGGDEQPPGTPAPRSAERGLRTAFVSPAGRVLQALVLIGAGVVSGAVWEPFHRSRGTSPDATASSRPELVTSPVEPPAAAPTNPATSAAPPASASPIGASAGASPESIESRLMEKAAGALAAGQMDVALSAVREHATIFHGGGRRAQQRETLWITALLRMGRTSEARTRFARFEALYPNSPRLDELRAALASP